MNRFCHAFYLFIAVFMIATSCQKETANLPYKEVRLNLPETKFNYEEPTVSQSFAFQMNNSNFNVTDAGATLGRVLFYDKQLSINNEVSCGSCHEQSLAFADGKQLSDGIDGSITSRNSMSIVNPFMTERFFWDGRSEELEDMVLKPIQNHVEMGMERISQLEIKLQGLDYYKPLFADAFGDEEVNRDRISTALSQFLSSMVSGSAKVDNFQDHWDFNIFTAEEQMGWNVFFGEGQCYRCHSGTNFDQSGDFIWIDVFNKANIGLDDVYTDVGIGAYMDDNDGVFKVPSLRNVELTGPYMHDGRFASLEEVVEHYNSGIKDHPNLDERLRFGETPQQLNLSEEKKAGLVAFLKTLTDENLITEAKYSDPFEE